MTQSNVEWFLKSENKDKESEMTQRIQNVIKRDGTIEPFEANKLNDWGKWAGRNTTAPWSPVVMKATKDLPKGDVHSDDLQTALIRAAEGMIEENPAYDQFAKELRLAQVRKNLFDSFDPPSLQFFHDHMVAVGAWEDMRGWITPAQFKSLNEVIDHTRDSKFTNAGLKQFMDKYSRRNIITGEVYETPQFAYMGMAMAMLSQSHWSMQDAIDLYNALSQQKINVPTPPLVGLRSTDRGFASCCLVDGTDTLDSIDAAEHVVFKMVAARAGIGYHLESRSIADPVRNGAFPHSGKLPYYRHIDRSVKANTQQSRGGSATVYMAYFDPEIQDIIKAKSNRSPEESKINLMDYNMKYNSLLLKRFLRKENITLLSYYYAPEVWEAFDSGDEAEFERLYVAAEKRLASQTKVGFKGESLPVAESIPATEIMKQFIETRMEVGRVYAMNTAEVNRNNRFKDPIRMSNLCVAPETKLLTKQGFVEISSKEGQEVEIWNGEEWSSTVIHKTGEDQELLKVSFSDGSIIECTPYHKFYVVDSSKNYGRRKNVKDLTCETRALDLETGMKMPKYSLPLIEGTKELLYPYTNGFFSGDGTYDKRGTPKLYFYEKGGKLGLVNKIEAKLQGSGVLDSSNRLSYIVKDKLEPKYFVPDSTYSISSRIKWLEGYLDADGCIQYNATTPSIVVSSVELEFLDKVKILLMELGVHSKVISARKQGAYELPDGKGGSALFDCKEAKRITIGSAGYWKLKDLGLNLSKDTKGVKRPNRDAAQFVTVVSVEETGRLDDTYCFTEPKLNLGVFNGILAGNCVEIVQPTFPIRHVVDLYRKPEELDKMNVEDYGEVSLCNLGGFALGRIETPEEWEKLSYILLKFVDTIIEIQHYPFPTLEYTAKKRRNVGIGLMNAAGAMAAKGLAFEGVEARNWIHQEAEKASYFLHKASVRLAQEIAPCEWFHRTKASDGELLIDTYKKSVDELVTVDLEMDWEALRADVLKYGMRNSVLTACMPGESSSVLLGVTNSVEPPRAPVVTKTSGVNRVITVAPGLDDWETAISYKYAFDIDRTEHIKWLAVLQKFVDQAISTNLYYDFTKYEGRRIPSAEVVKDLLNSTKYGFKTWYYANFNVENGGAVHDAGCASGGCTI